MARQHMSWIRPRDICFITEVQMALAASLCAVTGNGPTSRSETILLGRFASTPKAQRHCYKTIFTPPNSGRGEWTQSRYILRLRKNLEAKITQTLREPALPI